MSDLLPVVVYGATGYTGRLICRVLSDRGVRFAISGRDRERLNGLSREVGGPEVIAAALDDEAALFKMASAARVVLDCAGPFAALGRPVQDAALQARRHFLDITGEVGYMRDTYARDAEARAAKVALINAVGFDVVPTDAAAVLAAEAAESASELRIAVASRGSRLSRGTLRTILAGLSGSPSQKDADQPLGKERWQAPLPAPFGAQICISVPLGDLATASRSTGAHTVRTFMAVSRRVARMPLTVDLFGRLLGQLSGLKTFRSLAERLMNTRPEGPSHKERARGQFAVIAEATGRARRVAWVVGGDPYDFTARAAVECALRAAAPDFDKVGALTPTQAFGSRSLLDALGDAGVRYGLLDLDA